MDKQVLKQCIKEYVEGWVVRNGTLKLIKIEEKFEYTVYKKLNSTCQPYVVAYNVDNSVEPKTLVSWAYAKYFDKLVDAMNYFEEETCDI